MELYQAPRSTQLGHPFVGIGTISVPGGESWKANRRSGVALVTVVYPTSKYDFNDPSHVVMSNEYPACALLELWHS